MSQTLFSPLQLGSLGLRNRMVRSATWEGMATADGMVTDELCACVADLAIGGSGLIISSHVYVSPEGHASTRQVAGYSDEHVPGLTRMAEAAHKHGVPIVLQISHGGLMAGEVPAGAPRLAPSAFEGATPIDKAGIQRVVRDFTQAALRARKAGYDGVQIHAAHAYLLSEFLCPHCNKRDDEYGGSIANRARFLLEVVAAVREALGQEYPVLVKINSSDFLPDGISHEDFVAACAMLEQAGVAAIEISGGSRLGPRNAFPAGKVPTGANEGYYREAARLYKNKVKTPLILVGGIRTLEGAELLLQDNLADALSFSRPLIREPDFPARWMRGESTAVTCISCNRCHTVARESGGIRCHIK